MSPEWKKYLWECDCAMAELQCKITLIGEAWEIAQIAEYILERGDLTARRKE